jgi:hypothetical protein
MCGKFTRAQIAHQIFFISVSLNFSIKSQRLQTLEEKHHQCFAKKRIYKKHLYQHDFALTSRC